MFLVLILFTSIIICSSVNTERSVGNGTIYYFAYGSNLLKKRIQVENPSAVFYSTAKLEKYRLDFVFYSEAWRGALATIVEDDEENVWGSLWTLDVDQIKSLDNQEGVHLGWYFAKNVTVTTPSGKEILARTYQQTITPTKLIKGEDLPYERRPSNTYLEVIALGAIESRLPAEYIGFIISFPTNGQMATQHRRNQLGYPF